MLTQGTEGAICQLPDFMKGVGANGYIQRLIHFCNYALYGCDSCITHQT